MKSWMSLLTSVLVLLTLYGCNKPAEETAADTGNAATTATENAAESTEKTAEKTGEAAGKMSDSASDSVTNAGVTAKVKNAINLSPAIRNLASKINVDTSDTQVVLKGSVPSQKEAQEAVKLAKANAGSRAVVNQLKVGAK